MCQQDQEPGMGLWLGVEVLPFIIPLVGAMGVSVQ